MSYGHIYYIYGLFDDEECIYVGCTTDPKRRRKTHGYKGGKAVGMPHIKMRVFRETNDPSQAGRLENQILQSFFRKGQAKKNGNQKTVRDGSAPRGNPALPESRKRVHIGIYATADQKKKIEDSANALSISLSRYMLAASLRLDPAQVL